MTRKVFGTHAQTAHVWANQWDTINYGRSKDGRMFFKSGTIYSHGFHFPIAKFYRNKAGAAYVLFTTQSYSVSTNHHINHARQAIGYDAKNIFHVDNVECPDKAKADYEARISASLQKAPKRRGKNIQYELEHASDLANEANRFAEFTGARWRIKLPANDKLLEYAKAENNRAKERAKREAAKKAHDMLVTDKLHIEAWRKGENKTILKPAEMRAFRNAQLFTAADYELAERRIAEAWQAWRNGETYRAPENDMQNAKLRLSKDGKEIETSAGASFPTEHGIKSWPLLKRLRSRGETWERNGHPIHLGHFQIDKVEADGTVIAGCHKVAFAEYEAIAKQLGLA